MRDEHSEHELDEGCPVQTPVVERLGGERWSSHAVGLEADATMSSENAVSPIEEPTATLP